MSELVINQATWSDTGSPVRESIALENPGGFVVNVAATAEPPLQFRRCCQNAEDVNADTYGDAAEMVHRRGQLRADLGLDTEENPERARQERQRKMDAGLLPFPGFPQKSFG
jgi:hypothetical protein